MSEELERKGFANMQADLRDLGPNPTRESTLLTLLPHLQNMFGDVYEEYKPELEATYGAELVAAHKKLEEDR